MAEQRFVTAARVSDVPVEGAKVVTLEGHGVVLFNHEGTIYALDNRCPHMGFPLHRGTLRNGILTCEWHHARFDLCSGGTFDVFADDARTFPVDVRDGEIFVDIGTRPDLAAYHHRRLREGLEFGGGLVLAKTTFALLDLGTDTADIFRTGLDFGVSYSDRGWFQGLTMHTCFANLLPYLEPDDVRRALYQGLSAVRADVMGQPARFDLTPLPGGEADLLRLKRWFRDFVEVRDDEGAERCILSAVRSGASPSEVADILLAAATDHRYINLGHVVDFTNKAFEALDIAGWAHAEPVLASLIRGYVTAPRSEESLAWRHPIDLVALLDRAFDEIEPALEKGRSKRGTWTPGDALASVLLGDRPEPIVDALIGALADGATEVELSRAVSLAAAERIARFPISNELPDWDTALHTYTFANAVQQGLRRAPSAELLRGVFDAAMSVYLDRFLNSPAAALPNPDDRVDDPDALLRSLPELFNRQQQVNQAGRAVAQYLNSGGDPDRVLAMLGSLLLREDRDFHTIQTVETSFKQFEHVRGTPAGVLVLVAAARYLAAHAPTIRSQDQTFKVARRLHRGENVYEEIEDHSDELTPAL
jgi:nitrite reductase/ring-hydroxylating ferredoxin subunit